MRAPSCADLFPVLSLQTCFKKRKERGGEGGMQTLEKLHLRLRLKKKTTLAASVRVSALAIGYGNQCPRAVTPATKKCRSPSTN